ncbi:diacylglycerol kinase family lipid kinase [Metallumcola ferriviriculae]|uniref:diacylglycerol kinase (ATP) n=1 Tax=Metallumcola ferriviriculae TaxID=3039180 RepID=A0AAU0UHR8_9FIRM|nr:diacylglycerol kinase family lipid kinase [Desulfitibacteraceae bacterium MK1]
MENHVIVNFHAGRHKTKQLWHQVREDLRKTGWYLVEHETRYPGHATVLAQEAVKQGAKRLIAVGGDGTLNEAVNGLAGSRVALGVIPTGTGNDFARSVGISADPLQAIVQMYTGKEQRIDLGWVGERYFLNACGIGFDAQVANLINEGFKKITGKTAYLLAAVKVFLSFRPQPVLIEVDGKIIEKKIVLVAVTNGRYYGGGIKISPRAEVDDGLLDICIVEDLSRPQFVKNFPSIYSGEHVKHPKVSLLQGRRIVVKGNEVLKAHIDGEINGGLPLSYSVQPGALSLLMPVNM